MMRTAYYWKAKDALATESSGDAAFRLLQRLCIPDHSNRAAMDAWATQVKDDCSNFSGMTIVALCEAFAASSLRPEEDSTSFPTGTWTLPDPLLRRLAFELTEKRSDLEDGSLLRAASALERCGLKPGSIDLDLCDQPPQAVLSSALTATIFSVALCYSVAE